MFGVIGEIIIICGMIMVSTAPPMEGKKKELTWHTEDSRKAAMEVDEVIGD